MVKKNPSGVKKRGKQAFKTFGMGNVTKIDFWRAVEIAQKTNMDFPRENSGFSFSTHTHTHSVLTMALCPGGVEDIPAF